MIVESIPFHPIADCFRLLTGDEFEKLVADIRERGLKQPITLHPDGSILDGRNRYRACVEAGVEPRFVTWDGVGDEVDFVLSMNDVRRHDTNGERAFAAARLATLRPTDTLRRGPVPPIGETGTTQADAAEKLGVSKRSVERARAVLDAGVEELTDAAERERVGLSTAADVAREFKNEPETIREIVARGEQEILKAAKEIRAKKIAARHVEKLSQLADVSRFPAGTFGVVYADPPWAYSNSGLDQSAEQQYPTLPLATICAFTDGDGRSVRDIAHEASVLFLWATAPLLPDALRVMEAWGFAYKSHLVWVKDRAPGLGWWAKTRHELLLVGVRSDTPQPAIKPDSVVEAEVAAHSQKPDVFADIVERMFPGPGDGTFYVELFARRRRDGWAAFGNQVGGGANE